MRLLKGPEKEADDSSSPHSSTDVYLLAKKRTHWLELAASDYLRIYFLFPMNFLPGETKIYVRDSTFLPNWLRLT